MSSRLSSRRGSRIGSLILGMVVGGNALAVQVTYEFSATVDFVDPAASGFPSSLSGVNVGDSINGRVSYEASSPAAANPFGSVFGLATYYPLGNAEISIQVAGVLFDSWPGTLAAYVWNNDPTSAFPPGEFDGLIYSNTTMPNQLQFRIGNTILPTSTFPNEALPSGPVTGIYLCEFGLVNGGLWVRSNAWSLTQAIDETGDYNGDGNVGQDDFAFWMANFGADGNLAADGNGNGVVDAADFVVWRDRFGPLVGADEAAVVPEPATSPLFMIAVATVFCIPGICRPYSHRKDGS
jgi:hypothetical protein